jgi:hypothetical protein
MLNEPAVYRCPTGSYVTSFTITPGGSQMDGGQQGTLIATMKITCSDRSAGVIDAQKGHEHDNEWGRGTFTQQGGSRPC